MPHKTFNDGDVLTASDVMTYLMNQANIIGTSGGPPSSPTEAMLRADTDTDRIYRHNGSAWVWVDAYDNNNTTVTMESGFTASRNAVYRRGVAAWFTLTFTRSTNIAAGASVNVGVIPSGYRTAAAFDLIGATATGITCVAAVETDGVISVRPSALVASSTSIVLVSSMYPRAA